MKLKIAVSVVVLAAASIIQHVFVRLRGTMLNDVTTSQMEDSSVAYSEALLTADMQQLVATWTLPAGCLIVLLIFSSDLKNRLWPMVAKQLKNQIPEGDSQ